MRKALIVLLVVAAALAAAPTTIRIAMLAGPLLANGGVLVLAPNGQVQVASIGTGVSLTSTGNGAYVLQAVVPNLAVGVKPARQQDGTYLLPQQPNQATLMVYRNGVRQSPGDDYNYDASTKTIRPIVPSPWNAWNDDDIVLADYVY